MGAGARVCGWRGGSVLVCLFLEPSQGKDDAGCIYSCEGAFCTTSVHILYLVCFFSLVSIAFLVFALLFSAFPITGDHS